MEIIEKRIDELVEYANNPRDNTDSINFVAESIKEYGFINPITIDANNVIIAGHTRLKAALMLGMETVPCVVHDMSEEDARLARIIDNKSHEFTTWDTVKLAEEIGKIQSPAKDIFFKPTRDRKFRETHHLLIFGNVEIEISEADTKAFDAALNAYVEENCSHIGFINHLLGDRYA